MLDAVDKGAVLDEVTKAKPTQLFTGLLDAVDGGDMDPEVRHVVAILCVLTKLTWCSVYSIYSFCVLCFLVRRARTCVSRVWCVVALNIVCTVHNCAQSLSFHYMLDCSYDQPTTHVRESDYLQVLHVHHNCEVCR